MGPALLQILPAIDLRNGRCVRLRQGDYARETIFSDHPADMARRFEQEGAPRLHLVDLDGAKAGHPVNVAALRAIVESINIPCEVGGGVRDDEALGLMLDELGIDRAIVGTQALREPAWFRAAVRRYPGRVALGLDARDGRVATAGWLEVSHVRALDLVQLFADLPLAAVIYTNIANDGMMQGVDAATRAELEHLAELGFPVIASGGVTTLIDVQSLVAIHARQPRLVGAIIGRAIYEGTIDVAAAVALTRGQ
jgi:phosphoribosylformimino-5-aminoimidazole carboxamide ribotide isomerase